MAVIGATMTAAGQVAVASERATNLVATPGNRQIRLDWTEPSTIPSGYSLLGYYVVVYNEDDTELGRKECTNTAGSDESCTISSDIDGDTGTGDTTADDLQNGVPYALSVIPRWEDASRVEQVGDDNESERVTATPRTVPDAPVNPAVAFTGESEISSGELPTVSAVVSWQKPDDGGATIDQYDAVPVDADGDAIGPDGDSATTGDNSDGCSAAGEESVRCTMSGLALNSSFYFAVSATNDAGESDAAQSAQLITPPGPPSITSISQTSSGVVVIWTAPTGDAAITEYTVEALDGDGEVAGSSTWTSGSLRATIADLTEGERYTFQVTAQNTSTYEGNPLGAGYGVAGEFNQAVTISSTASGSFEPLTPVRIMNTRDGDKVGSLDVAGDSEAYELQVTGVAGVPADGVAAVALNVTAVSTEANDFGGYVTVYPCGTRPDASNLNFVSGQTIPNSVIAPVSSAGKVCFYVYGKAHLLADVSGYFGT
ncbi:MAG: fibronectin type III domain-containing protein [Actinomycetota bacterium]|nr:fibronectin type III domain-containing protein [Actinomycetota bacterium]